MKKSVISILSLGLMFTFVNFAKAEMDHSQMNDDDNMSEMNHKVSKGGKYAVHWSYKGKLGPSNWGNLDEHYTACKSGQEQSPINLTNAQEAKHAEIDFHYKKIPLKSVNNGHTVTVERDKGSYVNYKGKKYYLKQMHFHSPSEHTIDGDHSPMENHFVHANEEGELLVIGVMIKEGNGNMNYGPIFNNMPRLHGDKSEVLAEINAMSLLPIDKTTYYSYTGSLTTPPCSEGVTWIVMDEVVTIPKKQIKNFNEIYKGNNRPVQKINARNLTITDKE